jgi:hypothetical protein
MPKYYENCLAPDCQMPGSFCRRFCQKHYLVFRKACIENHSWGSGEPLAQPIVIEHWEFFGDEDSLAAMCEEQERLKAIKNAKQEPK